ncbi:unnamed protein product, partial [Symbiodinium necroappetens]
DETILANLQEAKKTFFKDARKALDQNRVNRGFYPPQKGKGKGTDRSKGEARPGEFRGRCMRCGKYGHKAQFCPQSSGSAKAKATGKGAGIGLVFSNWPAAEEEKPVPIFGQQEVETVRAILDCGASESIVGAWTLQQLCDELERLGFNPDDEIKMDRQVRKNFVFGNNETSSALGLAKVTTGIHGCEQNIRMHVVEGQTPMPCEMKIMLRAHTAYRMGVHNGYDLATKALMKNQVYVSTARNAVASEASHDADAKVLKEAGASQEVLRMASEFECIQCAQRGAFRDARTIEWLESQVIKVNVIAGEAAWQVGPEVSASEILGMSLAAKNELHNESFEETLQRADLARRTFLKADSRRRVLRAARGKTNQELQKALKLKAQVEEQNKIQDSVAEEKKRCNEKDLEELGQEKLTKGKFAGKTVETVAKETKYVLWLMDHQAENPSFIPLLSYAARKEGYHYSVTTGYQTPSAKSSGDMQKQPETLSEWQEVWAQSPDRELPGSVTAMIETLREGVRYLNVQVGQLEQANQQQQAALYQAMSASMGLQEQMEALRQRLEQLEARMIPELK